MATTLHSFLASHSPEYIDVVPWHWLEQDLPRVDVQIYASVVFLLICIPGNVGQILVITAYCRYVWFKTIVYYTWIKLLWLCKHYRNLFCQFFRSRKLRTASNRLLMSLLLADFTLLLQCYFVVYQSLVGAPVFGATGKYDSPFSTKISPNCNHIFYEILI